MFDQFKNKKDYIQQVFDYIHSHPTEFLHPKLDIPKENLGTDIKSVWTNILLLDPASFMGGWKPSVPHFKSLYDQLFYHYFDCPFETENYVKQLQLPWLPPQWFESSKPLPSGRLGQVFYTNCRLPWENATTHLVVRQVNIQQLKHYTCPSSVIGITATRSKYKKKNLALVSLAADASLEQLIPQADEWSFKKMMRTALATTAAVRDLHRQGKVHPNLQPRNLLVYQNRLELVDDQDCFAHKQDAFYGRWPYIAPEHQVTPSANIYSLGIMLWQLSSGIVFPHWVTTSPDLFRIRPLKHMDEGYQQLWKKCLSREPASRPTADDVCEALVQTMMSHMALGHECTNDMLKSEALAHAAEVRQHQMNIARYLAHVNPCVAKQALADMTERASLSKRMMFQMAVSIERRWQKSPKKERKRRVLEDDDCAMTSCNSVYGTDLPDFVQIGYV